MQPALPRENEARSLAALRALAVLDSAPEEEFDALVRAASLVCGVPISLISLIDIDRQWFKANIGLPGVAETPRELAFCAHAVLGEGLFEVPDAALDPRFADNPLVAGAPNIRFYAGAPVRLRDGSRIGTLCIIDRQPRTLTESQREVLRCLALAAARALEGRHASQVLREVTRENDERLRRQYEATPAMLHSIDAQGRLVAVSDMWLAKLGYAREEVLGRMSTDFLSPESRAFARSVVLPAFFASGRCESVAYQMLTRDGGVLDVQISATLERDAEGRPVRSLAVTEDVTLRRHAERELREEQQRVAHIIDGTDVGTWEWNLRTGELRINERFASIAGRSLDGPSATPIEALVTHVHPDDLGRCEGLLQQHFGKQAARYACEMRLRHRDGHWVWVKDHGRVTRWSADGRPEWMFGTRRDISERKQQEAALLRSQEFLRRTGKLAGVGGWELDIASGEITWSDETRRIHGVGPDYRPALAEAIAFYAPEARPVIQAAVERALAHGEPWDLELPLVRADGRPIWARAVGAVEFADGQAVRLAGAFQDITDRKTLELQLSAASAEVHDLYDNAPCGYHSLDADGRFLHINATALSWLGCSREALIGKMRAVDFFTSEGRAQFGQNFGKLQAEGRVEGLEFDLVPLRGAMRRVSINATAVRDAEGRFLMSRTVMFDITARSAAEKALRELTAIFDNTTDFVVQTDRHGAIVYMNPSVRRAIGIAADAPLTQLDYLKFNTPQTLRLYSEVITPALKAGAPVWVGEASVYLAEHREVPVSQIVIAHRDGTGRIERYSAVIRDISSDVAAQRQAQRQTATLRSVTEAIPATVAVVGTDGCYRFVNGAFERWWGMPRERIIGSRVQDIIGAQELQRRRPWVDRAFAGEAVDFVLDYPSRDGTSHVALSYVPLRLDTGEVDGFVVVTQDITHQKREELRLLRLSQRDPLTGLLNRAGFEQHLERAVEDGASLALLYIDLDRFKPVNDKHGHAAGDQILQIFAKRLVNLVRPTDAVARLGGDEFAIALTGARERSNAHAVGEKVLAVAHAPFHVGALVIEIGASVGIAFDADVHSGWQDLVERADAKLLAAKAAGKGRQVGAVL